MNAIPAKVKTDAFRLRQILINLIGNAIKFTQKGRVELRIGLLDSGEGSSRMRFDILDTGLGMTPEQRARLFESFSQADASTTRKYGGTGLGLVISKRLVQLMGGEIGVDSNPGQGSTFWFVVPLKKREQAAVAPAPTFSALSAEQRLQTEYAGTRVLLAEDEPIAQEISRGLLEDVGLMVEVKGISDGRGVASDVTVVRVTYVGDGKLVLRGCGEMVIGGNEDLGNSEEGDR
jgi:hypothetical protein